jgi:hypothetical protein
MGVSLGLIGGGGSILTVPILVYLFYFALYSRSYNFSGRVYTHKATLIDGIFRHYHGARVPSYDPFRESVT